MRANAASTISAAETSRAAMPSRISRAVSLRQVEVHLCLILHAHDARDDERPVALLRRVAQRLLLGEPGYHDVGPHRRW